MVLFATDIASRGLDFPSVDWVLQMDCPEDVAQYIHRVGRTARFTAAGHALLYLTPGEQQMAQQLKESNIVVTPIKVNPNKLQTVTPAMQALISKSTELKELAQRALVSYLRSVFLAPNKAVFDVNALNVEELSASFGLMAAPKLRFLKKAAAKLDAESDEDGEEGAAAGTVGSWALTASSQAANRMVVEPSVQARKAKPEGAEASKRFRLEVEESSDEEGGFMRIKRRIGEDGTPEDAEDAPIPEEPLARPAKKPKKMKIKVGAANPHAKRVVFDEDGNERNPLELLGCGSGDEDEAGPSTEGAARQGAGLDVGIYKSSATRMAEAARLMKQRDAEDRKQEKLKRKEKKLAAKRRAREEAGTGSSGASAAMLGGEPNDGEGSGDDDDEAPALVHMGAPHEDSSAASSSGSEDEDVPHWYKKPAKKTAKAPHVKNPEDLDSMSLADQQALAMQLMQRGSRR